MINSKGREMMTKTIEYQVKKKVVKGIKDKKELAMKARASLK